MPALLSHHLFGRTILARENNRVFMTRDTRDAFLLGNQGPDPLFYATFTPHLVSIKKLGSSMHREHIEEYLEAWREMLSCLETSTETYEVLQAYIYGFLCHFSLDSAVHPLVYAYEKAICCAGIEGLGPQDSSFVHGQIESDLDVYLLYRLTGRSLEEYQIPKHVLYASNTVLSHIDLLYNSAARFFGIGIPRKTFTRSVKNMRTSVRLMYSPGGTKRNLIGRAERLVRPHSLLQAMSHRPDGQHNTWYANLDKEQWLHPDSQKESTQSFDELFDAALDTAVSSMELFGSGAALTQITKHGDFSGALRPQSGEH